MFTDFLKSKVVDSKDFKIKKTTLKKIYRKAM